MKATKLIPFLVVLLVLAGLAVWRKNSEKKPASLASQVKLERLTPEGIGAADIGKVELFSGAKPEEKVVLEKSGEDWKITSLFNAPVNRESYDEFLGNILKMKGEFRATADNDERLAQYELKDDQAFHVLAYKAGETAPAVDLRVGKSADFRTVFVRRAGDKQVFVESINPKRDAGVSDSGGDGAVPKSTKWLKTDLLKLEKDKITKVALTLPDKQLVFERREKPKPPEEPKPEAAEGEGEGEKPAEPAKPEYEWVLASGGFAPAFSDMELQTLLGRFTNLTVTDVKDPTKKAEWGLETPQYKAVISVEGQNDVVLIGGRPQPGGDTYLMVEGAADGLVYQMNKINFEQIFAKGSPLFTLPGLTLAKEEITRVEIAGPDGRAVLEPAEGAWRVTEPALDLEAQKTAIDNLVTAAAAVKPADYADAGVDIGALDRTVTVAAGASTHVIRFGADSKCIDGVYVRLDDNPAALVLSKTDAAKLLVPVRDLYSMSVFSGALENVDRIDVRQGEAKYALLKEGEAWKLERDGAVDTAKPEAADDLLATLRGFQMKGFRLGEAPQLAETSVSVQCRKTDGSVVSVDFSPAVDGLHKAVVGGKAILFDVDAADMESLAADLTAAGEKPEPPKAPETVPAADAAAVPAAPAADAGTPAPEQPVVTIDPASLGAPAPAPAAN